jgi:hypothetical protein
MTFEPQLFLQGVRYKSHGSARHWIMNQLEQTSATTTPNSLVIGVVAAAAAAASGAPEWIGTATQPLEIASEFVRSSVIVSVLVQLVVRSRVRGWKAAVSLGVSLCVFQAAILSGSLIHEHKPLLAYAVRGAYAAWSTLVAVAVLGLCKVFAGGGRKEDAADGAPEPHRLALSRTWGRVNFKALPLAAVAAIVVGGLWYSPLLFGGAWAHLKAGASAGGAKVPPVEVLGEFVRSGVVAYVLARLINVLGTGSRGALLLGGALWLGFHATLLLFSVIHEHMPVGLFAIHAGHGLANDLVIAAIVGAWRPTRVVGSASEASTGAASRGVASLQ